MTRGNYDRDPMVDAVDHQVNVMGWNRAQARQEWERHYIEEVLDRAKGNVSEAARVAGIERGHLHRLIRRHGIRVPR